MPGQPTGDPLTKAFRCATALVFRFLERGLDKGPQRALAAPGIRAGSFLGRECHRAVASETLSPARSRLILAKQSNTFRLAWIASACGETSRRSSDPFAWRCNLGCAALRIASAKSLSHSQLHSWCDGAVNDGSETPQ
jgi:hypothetical protein